MLAVATIPTGLAFAVVDPWVVRSTGRARCQRETRSAAILRLIRREKPTAITTAESSLVDPLTEAAKRCGIPFIKKRIPKLPVAIASELYPELPLFAPGRLGRLAALAISAVLNRTPSPRTYANTRHNPSERRS